MDFVLRINAYTRDYFMRSLWIVNVRVFFNCTAIISTLAITTTITAAAEATISAVAWRIQMLAISNKNTKYWNLRRLTPLSLALFLSFFTQIVGYVCSVIEHTPFCFAFDFTITKEEEKMYMLKHSLNSTSTAAITFNWNSFLCFLQLLVDFIWCLYDGCFISFCFFICLLHRQFEFAALLIAFR